MPTNACGCAFCANGVASSYLIALTGMGGGTCSQAMCKSMEGNYVATGPACVKSGGVLAQCGLGDLSLVFLQSSTKIEIGGGAIWEKSYGSAAKRDCLAGDTLPLTSSTGVCSLPGSS